MYSSIARTRKSLGIKSPKQRLKEWTPIQGRFTTRLGAAQRRRIMKSAAYQQQEKWYP